MIDGLARKLGFASYQDYLESECWRSFRNKMIGRDCFCCGSKRKLQLHHVNYLNLGNESPEDVVTVCWRCHEEIHKLKGSGTPLRKAHFVIRDQSKNSRKSKRQKLRIERMPPKVRWFQLVHKQGRHTTEAVFAFLVGKKLANAAILGRIATPLAYKMGFCVLENGLEYWDVKKYLDLSKADKKFRKLQNRGRRVPDALWYASLVELPFELDDVI